MRQKVVTAAKHLENYVWSPLLDAIRKALRSTGVPACKIEICRAAVPAFVKTKWSHKNVRTKLTRKN